MLFKYLNNLAGREYNTQEKFRVKLIHNQSVLIRAPLWRRERQISNSWPIWQWQQAEKKNKSQRQSEPCGWRQVGQVKHH